MPIYIDGAKVNSFLFPGGECQVRIDPDSVRYSVTVKAILHSAYDIMELLLTVDAIRRVHETCQIHLYIPYLPYSRQDRVCSEGEAFSLKVFCNIVNSLDCFTVTILDPHSDVCLDLLDNCRDIPLRLIIMRSVLPDIIKSEDMILIAPDKGAASKVEKLAKLISRECFFAQKTRNTLSGEIVKSDLIGEFEGRNVIILDDICDGGRTFIELGKILKDKGADKLYLYVTNGIFSKGLGVLKEYFEHVYCFHTMLSVDEIDYDFLTVLENESNTIGIL